MGILDDAIREHLDLKKKHGARDAELREIEDDAFGSGERPDPFAAGELFGSTAPAGATETGSEEIPGPATPPPPSAGETGGEEPTRVVEPRGSAAAPPETAPPEAPAPPQSAAPEPAAPPEAAQQEPHLAPPEPAPLPPEAPEGPASEPSGFVDFEALEPDEPPPAAPPVEPPSAAPPAEPPAPPPAEPPAPAEPESLAEPPAEPTAPAESESLADLMAEDEGAGPQAPAPEASEVEAASPPPPPPEPDAPELEALPEAPPEPEEDFSEPSGEPLEPRSSVPEPPPPPPEPGTEPPGRARGRVHHPTEELRPPDPHSEEIPLEPLPEEPSSAEHALPSEEHALPPEPPSSAEHALPGDTGEEDGPQLFDFETDEEMAAPPEDAFSELGPAEATPPPPAPPAPAEADEEGDLFDDEPGAGEPASDEAPLPPSEGDDDLLAESPEFLDQEEDEDLWFEKGPPKDFDFEDDK